MRQPVVLPKMPLAITQPPLQLEVTGKSLMYFEVSKASVAAAGTIQR